MSENSSSILSYSDRLNIGFKALFSDMSADDIASQYAISRSYVYVLKTRAESLLNSLRDMAETEHQLFVIDNSFIEKSVLSLSLNCSASGEAIQRHLEDMHGLHVSTGKISGILNKYSSVAEQVLKEIDLSSIQQTANDEIFQSNQPILTTVDLESTYIVNMELCPDRSGPTWEKVMLERKAQGFNPKISISDGGSGLLSGIPKALPGIETRKDIFHAEKDLGVEIAKFERRAYKLIDDESRMIKATSGSRVHKKTKDKLTELQTHIDEDLELADELLQLYQWLKELLGFTGYPAHEVAASLHEICQRMLELVPVNKSFRRQVHIFEDNIDETIRFLWALQRNIREIEERNGWKKNSLFSLYQARAYYFCEIERAEWDFHCATMFGFDSEKRTAAEVALRELLDSTYRASSMIENVNGRIRDYIDCKRIVPSGFFPLLQLYLNTKKYRRSSVAKRRGKSPLELLTGKEHDSFYRMLGLE